MFLELLENGGFSSRSLSSTAHNFRAASQTRSGGRGVSRRRGRHPELQPQGEPHSKLSHLEGGQFRVSLTAFVVESLH